MINKIKLTNFRKHRDLEVVFGAGMSVIKAPNEGGKSTLGESIAYALFGSSALRDSIENVVAWGEHVNSLKVELDISIDGVSYNIKRSKTSAEINYDGGMVTNQKEVTSFVCRLLKVDAGAAARLTLSNQNEVRGALEAGPKATSELIERLAEFDQLDMLIELMQEKLTLGNPAAAEAALNSAQQQLERAKAEAIEPDTAAHDKVRGDAQDELEWARFKVATLELGEGKAQEAYTVVRERIAARSALVQGLERAQESLSRVLCRNSDAVANLASLPEVVNPDKVIGDLQQKIADAGDADSIAIKLAKVQPFTTPRAPDAITFEGSVDELREALQQGSSITSAGELGLSKVDGELKVLRLALTHGSCTFCGKDFSGVPEVAERNAAAQRKIDELGFERAALSAKVREQAGDNEILRTIELASRPALRALAETLTYSELADNELPPVLRWTGPTAGADGNATALRAELKSLQASISARAAALARMKDLDEDLVTATADAVAAEALLSGTVEESAADVLAALNLARQNLAAAREVLGIAVARRSAVERAATDAAAAYARAVALVEEMTEVVESRSKEVTALEFNNALLKRVRQCRPLIVDKLWAIVLAAVSSYFSEIRGTPSVVSKDADGFKIDEHVITSMSGSTLDALGLAIRVALVRTFLPNSPFLILDEPSQGMDSNRTANLLGFISTCGFQQCLLITHEDVSLGLADHIIQL